MFMNYQQHGNISLTLISLSFELILIFKDLPLLIQQCFKKLFVINLFEFGD